MSLRTPRFLRRARVSLLAAIGLLGGCNAIFGIEEGALGGAGGSGASSSASGGGGGSGGSGGGDAGPCVPRAGERTGAFRWAHGSSGSVGARSRAMAFGSQNDIVVAGVYAEGPLTFGNTTLPAPSPESVFVATFDQDTGLSGWAREFPASGALDVADVAVGPDGAIALGGAYESGIDVGTPFVQLPGGPDGFVVTLDATGQVVGAWNLGTMGETFVTSLAFDGNGALFVAAVGVGAIDLGSGPVGSAGVGGVYLFKLNGGTGVAEWGRFFDAGYYAGAFAGVTTAPTGEVYLTGPATSNSYQSYDAFRGQTDLAVVKMDAEGVILWSRLFGGTAPAPEDDGSSWGTALTVLCDGDVVVTGGFSGDLRFDEVPVLVGVDTDPDPYYRSDIFVARLSGDDGKAVWAHGYSDIGPQSGRAVASDPSGDILVSGVLIDGVGSAGVDFGKGLHGPSTDDGGAYREDFFLLKLDAEGVARWSKRLRNEPTGEFIQEGDTALRPDGLVGFAGDFYFSIDVDGSPNGHLTSAGRDMFVGTFEP